MLICFNKKSIVCINAIFWSIIIKNLAQKRENMVAVILGNRYSEQTIEKIVNYNNNPILKWCLLNVSFLFFAALIYTSSVFFIFS